MKSTISSLRFFLYFTTSKLKMAFATAMRRELRKLPIQAKKLRAVQNLNRSYTDWPFLTDEHRMISDMCRNFAETELKPIAGIIDKEHRYPKEQVEKLGELGTYRYNSLFLPPKS